MLSRICVLSFGLLLCGVSFTQDDLSPHEQHIYDQIRLRLDSALAGYYAGHPLEYAELFHEDGVYGGQTYRYVGKDRLMETFSAWEGKTNFSYELQNIQFTLLDARSALLTYNVQEEDHTLWLGSEVWTLRDDTWGLIYAHWAYDDLNKTWGMPRQTLHYVLLGALLALIIGFIIGRIYQRRSVSISNV